MTTINRRTVLRAGLLVAGAGVLSACTSSSTGGANLVLPTDPRVAEAEARRHATGRTQTFRLTAQAGPVDLGGPQVTTWTYDGVLPGKEIRVRAGDTIHAELTNRLPAGTSIHWHGIALRNDMDGVPGVTQPPVQPGSGFTYEFTVPDAGTYFFHPHVGLQLDRGLYGVLLVDDPAEPGGYDQEAVVVLDDWTLGVGPTPEQLQGRLMAQPGMMGGMDMGMMGQGGSQPLGVGGGMIDYPLYLLGGHPPDDPATIAAKPGQRLRLRVINAAADTAFRLAIGGHRLVVTHTDGLPVAPVTVDALLVGMGERCDALVSLHDGAFPLVALAEGKAGQALGILRTSGGRRPAADARPAELDGRLAAMAELDPDQRMLLPARRPDRTHRLVCSTRCTCTATASRSTTTVVPVPARTP